MDQAESLRRQFGFGARAAFSRRRQVLVATPHNALELPLNLRAMVRMVESECTKIRVKKFLHQSETSALLPFEFTTDPVQIADDMLVVLEAQNSVDLESLRTQSLNQKARVFVVVNSVTSAEAARNLFMDFKEALEKAGWAEIHYLGHLSIARSGNRFLPLLKWGRDRELPQVSQLSIQWIAKRLIELMEPMEG